MTGVDGAKGVTVDCFGESKSVSPGMAVDSFSIPRPLVELPPVRDDEPAAATPERVEGLDDGDEVGDERAPANDSDVVVEVVVELADVFAGATAPEVVVLTAVESML